MSDAYAYAREQVADALSAWNAGAVTLTRKTRAAPHAETPWTPGAAVLDVYALDARTDGVAAAYVDSMTVLASDLMVIASPKARHTMSAGEAADGAVVDLVPRMSDTLQIDGAEKTIKKIVPVPASGSAAMFHIVVAS